MVIFSHSFGLISGIEPGCLGETLGGWAVLGFFCLSGFLVSRSWQADPDPAAFFLRRATRIVPGFVVAFAACVFLVAPLAGVTALPAATLWDLLTLNAPSVEAFRGTRGAVLDASMWTIRWEVVCYAATPILAFALRYRAVQILALIALAALSLAGLSEIFRFFLAYVLGAMTARSRLALPELAGLRWPDVSYGTYLYGWPVQKLLVWGGMTSPWALFALALPISLALGLASHALVERPAMRLGRRWRRRLALA